MVHKIEGISVTLGALPLQSEPSWDLVLATLSVQALLDLEYSDLAWEAMLACQSVVQSRPMTCTHHNSLSMETCTGKLSKRRIIQR